MKIELLGDGQGDCSCFFTNHEINKRKNAQREKERKRERERERERERKKTDIESLFTTQVKKLVRKMVLFLHICRVFSAD